MKLINLEEAKTFLKSRRFNSETKEWWVLALSPTVIDELDSLQTIDPIATIDDMIDDELNPEWTTINENRLRCLEDVIWRIKWQPPSRHNIT